MGVGRVTTLSRGVLDDLMQDHRPGSLFPHL